MHGLIEDSYLAFLRGDYLQLSNRRVPATEIASYFLKLYFGYGNDSNHYHHASSYIVEQKFTARMTRKGAIFERPLLSGEPLHSQILKHISNLQLIFGADTFGTLHAEGGGYLFGSLLSRGRFFIKQHRTP